MPSGKEFFSFWLANDNSTHWLTHSNGREAYKEASLFASEVGDGWPSDDTWIEAIGAFIVDHDAKTVQMIRLILNDSGKPKKVIYMAKPRPPSTAGYLNFRIVNGEIYDPLTFMKSCSDG